MDNKIIESIKENKIKILVFLIFFYRGSIGYYDDLKEYIINSEIERIKSAISVDTLFIPKIKSQNEILKEKIYKEKGIILTDEDIKNYLKK